jgi:hypothetical protein
MDANPDINVVVRLKIEKQLRALGITAAARFAGVSDAAVHRWLSGKKLSRGTLNKLVGFAGLTMIEKITFKKKKQS